MILFYRQVFKVKFPLPFRSYPNKMSNQCSVSVTIKADLREVIMLQHKQILCYSEVERLRIKIKIGIGKNKYSKKK